MGGRYDTRELLLSAAAGWMSSNHYFNSQSPGPWDDAEMALNDDRLLIAARSFVEAHEDDEPILG
jgi:hypothetical protein